MKASFICAQIVVLACLPFASLRSRTGYAILRLVVLPLNPIKLVLQRDVNGTQLSTNVTPIDLSR
jgi:hypothetical protein